MSKRYRKMAKKANGKIREIRDGQVILEIPLPVADVLAGIPEAVEGLSQEVGLMLIWAGIKSECEKIAGRKDTKNPLRTANWWAVAALLSAERKFKRVKGYREIPKLIAALQQKNLYRKEVCSLIYGQERPSYFN
ncbi:MAG: hypothetical protein HY035_05585 [Nitrospirae bacterium]|nr:hypothetical protein [Nitrospirota bacterium]